MFGRLLVLLSTYTPLLNGSRWLALEDKRQEQTSIGAPYLIGRGKTLRGASGAR